VRNRWARLQATLPGQPNAKCKFASTIAEAASSGQRSAIADIEWDWPNCTGRQGSAVRTNAVKPEAVGNGGVSPSSSRSSSTEDFTEQRGTADFFKTHTKVRNSVWTAAEDKIIAAGVLELGHKWLAITRRLPGRTEHATRNRWSRLQSIIGQHNVNNIASQAWASSP